MTKSVSFVSEYLDWYTYLHIVWLTDNLVLNSTCSVFNRLSLFFKSTSLVLKAQPYDPSQLVTDNDNDNDDDRQFMIA